MAREWFVFLCQIQSLLKYVLLRGTLTLLIVLGHKAVSYVIARLT